MVIAGWGLEAAWIQHHGSMMFVAVGYHTILQHPSTMWMGKSIFFSSESPAPMTSVYCHGYGEKKHGQSSLQSTCFLDPPAQRSYSLFCANDAAPARCANTDVSRRGQPSVDQLERGLKPTDLGEALAVHGSPCSPLFLSKTAIATGSTWCH